MLDPIWSVQNPTPVIDNLYAYTYLIDTMFKSRSGALFAAGYSSASTEWVPIMNRSTDNGVTWKSVALPTGSPNPVYTFSMAEDKNSVLYAGGKGLWKSIDDGNTWSALPMPYPDSYWGGFAPINSMFVAKDNSLIASFGSIGVSVYEPGYLPTKVFRSADGGNTWNELFSNQYEIASMVEADD